MSSRTLVGFIREIVGNGVDSYKTDTTYPCNTVINSTSSDVAVKSKDPNWKIDAHTGPKPVLAYSRTVISSPCFFAMSGSGKATKKQWPWTYINASGKKYNSVDLAFTSLAAVEAAYPLHFSAITNNAKATLNQHINNMYVDALTEAGEAKQTLGMLNSAIQNAYKYALVEVTKAKAQSFRATLLYALRNPYHAITGTGSAIQRTTGKRAIRRAANQANNAYLQFNYGWKPLMSTIGSAYTMYQDQVNGKRARKKMSGTDQFQDVYYSGNYQGSFDGNSTLPTFTYRFRHSITAKIWVGGLLEPAAAPGMTDVAKQLGLRGSNIIPSLWQLLSCSFIVDYFVNIGDLLNNLSAPHLKLQPQSLYLSKKVTVETTLEIVSITPRSSDVDWTRTGTASLSDSTKQTAMFFTRTPIGISGIYVMPSFKDPSWASILKTMSVAVSKGKMLRV